MAMIQRITTRALMFIASIMVGLTRSKKKFRNRSIRISSISSTLSPIFPNQQGQR